MMVVNNTLDIVTGMSEYPGGRSVRVVEQVTGSLVVYITYQELLDWADNIDIPTLENFIHEAPELNAELPSFVFKVGWSLDVPVMTENGYEVTLTPASFQADTIPDSLWDPREVGDLE